MKRRRIQKALLPFATALLLWPLGAVSQTVRGDFDYDGDYDLTDLTTLINYLLTEDWNDVPSGLECDTITVKGTTFVMVHVEGGILTREDGGMYQVDDFWICQTEVTTGLWASFMGGTPINPQTALSKNSWYDCQDFIDALNAYTGRQFRLPTCNEWEFAARGGNRSGHFTYCGGNDLDVLGWYAGNCNKCMPVGLLKCNELGLYDMSGNVTEWCQDSHNGNPDVRYYCGGRWYSSAADNTPSSRGHTGASNRYNGGGFRLAM